MAESIVSDLKPGKPEQRGQLVKLKHDSSLLRDNLLGEPYDLVHDVYLPPGYTEQSQQRYPVICCLAAYTNAGPGQVAWRNHGETVPERLDRLQSEALMGPVIVIFPNAYNALGGNQYVNSSTIGPWADVIRDELMPLVDQQFNTLGEQARAVFGKSSGGFGALHLAMTQPGSWQAAASHAGDAGFDRVALPDFPKACMVFERYRYDLERFVKQFWRRKKPGYDEFHALMVLCLAASYDPQPDQPLGLRLPFTPNTCELIEEAWQNWQSFDPVRQSDLRLQNLNQLRGFWLDVGCRDQYHIQFGTRQLHHRLEELAVRHHFEEFEGNHSGIDWRLDESLPFLYRSLMDD